ncbi:MAG: Crp/Fnr family transcriptional regulator [bacterium]
MESIEFLKTLSLFKGISEDAIRKILAIAKEKRYKKGEIIYYQGDISYTLDIIKKGKLKVTIMTEEGKEKILAILSEGDIIGEISLIDNRPRSATVEALEDCSLLSIKKEDFGKFLLEYPKISIEIARILSERLRDADRSIEELTFYDVRTRIISLLISLGERYGKPISNGIEIHIRFTHQELADLVGSSRETITRVLGELQENKIIRIEKDKILIIAPEKLKIFKS